MKCLDIKTDYYEGLVRVGDIIIFSKEKAFLIVRSDIEYLAIQLMNNGNEDLGFIRYTDANLFNLLKRLGKDFGKVEYVKNMNKVGIKL